MPDTFVRSRDDITQSTLDVCTSVLTLLPACFFFALAHLCRFFQGRMQTGFPLFKDATKEGRKKKKKILFSAATSKLSNTERDLRTDRGKLNLDIHATFGTI